MQDRYMNSSNRQNQDQDFDSFSLKQFLGLCLKRWIWFVVSLIIFVGLGLLYIYTRQPVFERSEEILVKDNESGGGVVDNAFSSLGLFSNSTKVYNELIAFTSPAVMFEVVERLNLQQNYTRRDGLKKYALYGTNQPIDVEFQDLTEYDNAGLTVMLQPDGRFTVRKIKSVDEEGKMVKYKEEVDGVVDGNAVNTPLGKVIVKRNPYYAPNPMLDDKEQEIEVFQMSFLSTVEMYVTKLDGNLTDQDADVINLSIDDTSIQRADDILNMVVAVYNERWIEDKNKVSVATSKFISERLEIIGRELEQLDDQIAVQKSEMHLPNLEESARGFIEQGFKLNEGLLEVTNRLSMAQFLKEYLENPNNTFNIIPTISGTENAVLEQQIGTYNTMLLTRNNLAENSSDDNPIVQDYNNQLAGMRAAIIRSVDSNIASLKRNLANIEDAQGVTKDYLGNAPMVSKSLQQVTRQQLVMQELYLFLLQKREENELSQTFISDNIRIITPPYGKLKPVSPKKSLLLIVFIILGVGIPAAFIFISESSNTKIRSKKDVENLRIPYAGEIPKIGKRRRWKTLMQSKKKKRKEVDKPLIVVKEGKRDIPNEAFRVVRSNIDFMLPKGVCSVLAFTSFNPGSGKSFISFNLGVSFALKGKKVLLIDGDLRHGSISKYVSSPRKGLTTFLTGNAPDWHSLIVHSEGAQGLDILPIGHRPPNPAELLDSNRFGELMEEARREYDIVLIDCPPVNIVVDTQIINQYVSRTIFVVRAGLFEKKGLKDIAGLVEEDKLRNIVLLLNDTSTEFSSYHTYGNYEAIDNI